MGMKWPANPGPDEWYVEAVPERPDDAGCFSGVWLVIRSMAFPAHRNDFKFVKLGVLNFDWQWDFALKQSKALVSRLNLCESSAVEEPHLQDVLCAECGEQACLNDYLCDTCGESVRQSGPSIH
jgi:hypothetical protein